jgi:hypothetical protein
MDKLIEAHRHRICLACDGKSYAGIADNLEPRLQPNGVGLRRVGAMFAKERNPRIGGAGRIPNLMRRRCIRLERYNITA